VRKAGKHVRITAQLIDTGSGFHLWSETYDRDLDNIFQVQEEIARAIVDALKLPLLGHDAAPLSVAKAKNVEAYDLYLLGRHHARETTAAAFEKAIDYYEQAIEADPEFALAYSGLADAYMYLSDYGGIAITDADRSAEPAVRRALELDPRSAEPYASMGLIMDYRGRASDALGYFDKALAINPNYVNALLWKSNVLRDTGRHLDALSMNEQAYELDPLSGFVKARLVGAAMSAGQFARAESLIAEMRDANPDDPFPYEEAGNLWFMRGELDRAVPDYVMAHRLRPGDTYMAWKLVQSFVRLDDESGARAWLAEAAQRGREAIYTIRARAEFLRYMADARDYLAYAIERAGLEPDNALLLGEVGLARFMTGDLAGAETDLRATLSLAGYRPADGVLVANQAGAALPLAAVLSVQGESAEADKLLSELDELTKILERQQPAGTGPPLIEAFTAAIRGDRDRMFEAFDRAVERGFRGHRMLLRDPVLRPYLDDPDLQALIERMREDEAEMRRRLEASDVTRLPGDEPGV
jgi:tetratricopeptide (TPR) repeat protein